MFSIKSKLEWLATLCRHSGVGLWDAVVHNGDPAHEKSRWTWSPEMRRLCGYGSEKDFPNKMTSWSNLLHRSLSKVMGKSRTRLPVAL
jgi:hypothetical protein